jgi:hypothetical protein
MAKRKYRLYRDRSCISELESFLTQVARRRFGSDLNLIH